MTGYVEPATAFRAVADAYDLGQDAGLRARGPAFRSGVDDRFVTEVLERRRRYLLSLATRLGLDPDRAAEILRGPTI